MEKIFLPTIDLSDLSHLYTIVRVDDFFILFFLEQPIHPAGESSIIHGPKQDEDYYVWIWLNNSSQPLVKLIKLPLGKPCLSLSWERVALWGCFCDAEMSSTSSLLLPGQERNWSCSLLRETYLRMKIFTHNKRWTVDG